MHALGPLWHQADKADGRSQHLFAPMEIGFYHFQAILHIQLFVDTFTQYIQKSHCKIPQLYLYQLPWRAFLQRIIKSEKEDVECTKYPYFLSAQLKDINSKDAFHCISELRVVSNTNQLSILVEYIFIENVCVFMENR